MSSNQGRCPVGTCSNKALRESGCFICSKQHGDDEKCETCLEDHIVYDGTCVGCLSMEVCPFNNSDVGDCIDEHDLSHCVDQNPLNCSDHVCISVGCGDGNVADNEECEIGGMGCRGCVCMKGWYSNHSNDCFSKCGDGIVVGKEECDSTENCDNNCKCKEGFAPSEINPGVCVLQDSSSSSSSSSDSDSSSSSEKKKPSVSDQMHIGKFAFIFAVVISFIFL